MDSYQQILTLPYVIGLVLSLANNPRQHPSGNIDIIKLEERFYIKKSNDDLCIIKENMKHYSRVTDILDTIILFEKYKLEPMEFYIYLSRNPQLGRQILIELFRFLHLQFSVNKDYFLNK